MDLLRYFERQQVKEQERPRLKAGDVVRVEMKVREGGKTRRQTFEGIMLGIRGSGPSTTFMVRRETGGFGVERIFPLYSPLITNIEVVKRQKVRRAKLTYLRRAGRRRFKEDVKAMQRYMKEEEAIRHLRQAQSKQAQASSSAKATEDKEEEIKKEPEDSKTE